MFTVDLEDDLSAFEAQLTHHVARNGDIRIHYASIGTGPLVVFLHGFPDHWLTWWQQMAALSPAYRCVAPDLRGYNLSDRPAAVSAYAPDHLTGDVAAVIADCGAEDAVVIGHDWGGFVAWHMAMDRPRLVSRLGIVNMPHPWAIARELAVNPAQREASAYVRQFQHPQAHQALEPARLSAWVRDAAFAKRHAAALVRSDANGMLNYYRACFPAPPYAQRSEAPPPVTCPTLAIHALEDPYALPAGLNDLWQWVEAELTIETWPGIGHFVQQDAPERLTRALRLWLASGEEWPAGAMKPS
ncbi:epoxide hydrolase [Pseudodonghicola xiamenensis]|uniref:Epoxide hydrolase n=2 Tax=Pseudodonghicola xiamenensis TaxID=337702 RepID=A0A8J3HAQ7_9RHOB|nr:epoxide hydrolase [Pseudodonghicola xiamenensis]